MKSVEQKMKDSLESKTIIEQIYHTKFVDGLIVLLQSKEPIKVGDLGREAGTTQSYGSRLSRKYEFYGLATRSKKGRATQIELTPKGQTVARQLQKQQMFMEMDV